MKSKKKKMWLSWRLAKIVEISSNRKDRKRKFLSLQPVTNLNSDKEGKSKILRVLSWFFFFGKIGMKETRKIVAISTNLKKTENKSSYFFKPVTNLNLRPSTLSEIFFLSFPLNLEDDLTRKIRWNWAKWWWKWRKSEENHLFCEKKRQKELNGHLNVNRGGCFFTEPRTSGRHNDGRWSRWSTESYHYERKCAIYS